MRVITAAEASRSFASVLDEVERGETVVVTRGGRRIATIGPASASNGAAVRSLLNGPGVDDEFASDVDAAGRAARLEGPAWSAELRTGVELATDRHRAGREAFVRRVLQAVPVEPYDLATAEAHGRLLDYVHAAVCRGEPTT